MNRKLGEIGKVTGQTIIIIGLIALIVFLAYYKFEQRESGGWLQWSIVLDNGDIIPLDESGTYTLYRGLTSPFALYTDPGCTNKVNGFRCDLYLKPVTESTNNVTITSTIDGATYGNYLQIIKDGTTKWSSGWIGKPNASIQPNVETKLADWYGVVGAVNFGSLPSGTYTIQGIYTFKASVDSLSGVFNVEGTVTAYWKANTLDIVARVGWSPVKIVG